mmetsp:Transcript_39345/g.87557  ORF Transcript_39345/g.87557 Transcript_39345/m.87557 type:complete len:186 (+) Transcript_39345:30-587(+)
MAYKNVSTGTRWAKWTAALLALFATAVRSQSSSAGISCWYTDVTNTTTGWQQSGAGSSKTCALIIYTVGGKKAITTVIAGKSLPVGDSYEASPIPSTDTTASCDSYIAGLAQANAGLVKAAKAANLVESETTLKISGACCNSNLCNNFNLPVNELAYVSAAALGLPNLAMVFMLVALSVQLLTWL